MVGHLNLVLYKNLIFYSKLLSYADQDHADIVEPRQRDVLEPDVAVLELNRARVPEPVDPVLLSSSNDEEEEGNVNENNNKPFKHDNIVPFYNHFRVL